MLEYIVVWIKRVYKRIREPSDHVLVIWTGGYRVGKIEEVRIVRRRVEITSSNGVLIS